MLATWHEPTEKPVRLSEPKACGSACASPAISVTNKTPTLANQLPPPSASLPNPRLAEWNIDPSFSIAIHSYGCQSQTRAHPTSSAVGGVAELYRNAAVASDSRAEGHGLDEPGPRVP